MGKGEQASTRQLGQRPTGEPAPIQAYRGGPWR